MMQNTKQLYILFYYIEFLNCFEFELGFLGPSVFYKEQPISGLQIQQIRS